MDLAQHYGTDLFTGVFYRDPAAAAAYGDYVAERQASVRPAPGADEGAGPLQAGGIRGGARHGKLKTEN